MLLLLFKKLFGVLAGQFFAEGHHHLNDVFALRLEGREAGGTVPTRMIAATGSPRLRPTVPARFPIRDRRRARQVGGPRLCFRQSRGAHEGRARLASKSAIP